MTPDRKTRVALCGIGGYGETYAMELLRRGPERNTVFAAAVDPAAERSGVLAEIQARSIPVFASLDGMGERMVPDLVVVSTPIHLHAAQSILSLRNGSSVLCEKPLAATLQDARLMAEAARRAGRMLEVGYQWSFSPAVQAMKQAIMAGRFGRPLRLKTLVLSPRNSAYYGRAAWAGKVRTPAGEWVLDSPVNNAHAHYLHNMLYLLGHATDGSATPLSVQAELHRANDIENYDTAALRVALAGGVEMLFFATHAVNVRLGPIACYEFEQATISYQAQAGNVFEARLKTGERIRYGDPDDNQMRKLWRTVEAIQAGEPSSLCGAPAASAHTACVAAAQKCETTPFPKEFLCSTSEANATQTWVPSLPAAFAQCYNLNLLPSEIGSIPWAVPGSTVDVSDGATFRGRSNR
jgi:predicted dehydrogenase